VNGGAGAVGTLAIGLARQAGARVLATVLRTQDVAVAQQAGAQAVVCSAGRSVDEVAADLRQSAPAGVHHVVEVDFASNLALDRAVLRTGGSIAAYASGQAEPVVPFWPLVFQNISIHHLGSDDFTPQNRRTAAQALNRLLGSGWRGIRIARHFTLSEVVQAHQHVEQHGGRGRVLLDIPSETAPWPLP
jgi:NADPH2:quinone reductase